MMSLLICNHPPEVLQPSGVGGAGGATGATTLPGVVSGAGPAGAAWHIESTDAYWMNPRSSKPGATVCAVGNVAGVGGTVGLGSVCAPMPTARPRISSRPV